MNYLLYGLYKLDYVKIEKEFSKIIKIEECEDSNVAFQINVNSFIKENLDSFISIFQDLVKENFAEIFISSNTIPEIKVELSEWDKVHLEVLTNDSYVYNLYTNFLNNINSDTLKEIGVFSFEKGILKLVLHLNTNDKKQYISDLGSQLIKTYSLAYINLLLQGFTQFSFFLQKEELSNIFFFPAERATLNQYAFDIVFNKQERYEKQEKFSLFQQKENKTVIPEYPLAINDYIKLVFNLRKRTKQTSEFADIAQELEQNLLNGTISVNEQGSISYKIAESKNLDLYESSSTIKSLSVFVLYLRHLANKADVIFIDEPELNLHPKNQIVFARILAKLVNKGIKVFLSTHSDFITKELSTMVLLSNEFEGKEEIKERFGFNGEEFLNKEKIGLYRFEHDGIVKNIPVSDRGIEIESFDKVIDYQNQLFEHIYFKVVNNE